MGNSDLKLANRLFLFLWRKKYRDFVIFSLLFLILLGAQYWFTAPAGPAGLTGQADNLTANTLQVPQYDCRNDSGEPVKVERVVDGDTFVYKSFMNNGEEVKVRLLGVDTPETLDPRKGVQCFGKEASDETKKLIEGKIVRVWLDCTADTRDKYGRELRYVSLLDHTNVNRYLVENGFAHATREYPYSYKEEFVNLENQARIQEKGLWSPIACN